MIRLLLLVLILAGLAAGAAALANNPGQMTLEWLGWRVEMSVAAGLALIFLTLMLVLGLMSIWRQLWRGEGMFAWLGPQGRHRRAMDAFARGFAAVSAGDVRQAKRLAQRTEALMDDGPLAKLLVAQTAELGGDNEGAKAAYGQLLGDQRTRLAGLRGLIRHATADGNRAEALSRAEEAAGLAPRLPWVLDALFDLQAGAGLWPSANETLDKMQKAKHLDKAQWKRRRAVLLTAEAQAADQAGDGTKAAQLAKEAVKLAPDLTPAVLLLAKREQAAGNQKKAFSLLADAWSLAPHPDLAQLSRTLQGPVPATERVAQTEKLIKGRREDPESRMTLATDLLEARRFREARAELEPLLDNNPRRRVLVLMGYLEEEITGDDAAARAYLERAFRAAPDPLWVCKSCGRQDQKWNPVCPRCADFDSHVWAAPDGTSLTARPGLMAPELESPEDEGPAETQTPDRAGPQIANAQMLLPRAPDDPGPMMADEDEPGSGPGRGPAY